VIRAVTAAALLAPLLSACVIYANEGGEHDVSVRFDEAAPALEAVRSARIENGRLVVRVDSSGCTDAADFVVELTPADGWIEAALRRTDPDLCKALVPDGVEVSWSLVDLDLEPGQQLRLVNPTRL
jgi:hypothetical protein